MMWTENNIFEPSGCITRDAFKALLRGELPLLTKKAAETHIEGCSFCSDARDGFTINKASYNELLDVIDKDFQEKYTSSSPKIINRKVWISAIAAAASVLLFISLFQLNKTESKTEQIALKEEKKADSTGKINKPAVQSNNQIALSTDHLRNKSDKNDLQRETEINFAKEKIETTDELAIVEDSEEESVQSINAVDVAPSASYNFKLADTIMALDEKEAKMDDNSGYLAFAKEKQSKTEVSKKSLTSRAAKQETPAPAMDYAPDEKPRFKYKGFNDFGKYIESQLPPITDSSNVVKIYIEVTIDEKGTVADARIVKGVTAEADKTIINKVKDSPRWIPAEKAGVAVKTKVYYFIWYNIE